MKIDSHGLKPCGRVHVRRGDVQWKSTGKPPFWVVPDFFLSTKEASHMCFSAHISRSLMIPGPANGGGFSEYGTPFLDGLGQKENHLEELVPKVEKHPDSGTLNWWFGLVGD